MSTFFKTITIIVAAVGTLGLVQGDALAQTGDASKKDVPWNAQLGFNAIANSGNAVNQNFGGDGKVSYRFDANKLAFSAEGAYGRAKDPATGVTSVNSKFWKTRLRYDRYFQDVFSAYASSHIGRDQPAGFDYRYGGSAGLGHDLLKTDAHAFRYEIGYDFTREQRLPPPNANIQSARTFLDYKWTFTEKSAFGQDAEALFNVINGNDVRLNTNSYVSAQVIGKLALKLSFGVRFDNRPVTGKKKLDTSTQFGLTMDFI